MLSSFHLFESLPVELQAEIWSFAVRPTKPGVQIFSLSSDPRDQPDGDSTQEPSWGATYFLSAPKWAFGPISCTVNTLDEILASWTKNNSSTYLVDSGLWNACRHSHRVMRNVIKSIEPMVVQTKVERGSRKGKACTSGTVPSQKRTIIVSPSKDLFILQFDNPDMLSWCLLEDIVPFNVVPSLVQIRHVGWQYHPIWSSSLRDSPWIASLNTLCSYIVYGMKFGGLETLWLINYRIRRKHWVPSKSEATRKEPKVFEIDDFRFTEVFLDDNLLLPEQLRWDEVVPADDPYGANDFLAFVTWLRLLVSHILMSTSTLQASRRSMSIKVLACESL